MVKIDTLNAILKHQGSVRNIDKAQRLVDNLCEKIKIDVSANPLIKYNPDLMILVGRFVVSKFESETFDFKRDLILRVMVALCGNVPEADKKVMSYLIECLLKGDHILKLSTTEYCMSFITDFLKRLM